MCELFVVTLNPENGDASVTVNWKKVGRCLLFPDKELF